MFEFSNIYVKYLELSNKFLSERAEKEIKDKSQYFTPLNKADKIFEDINIIEKEQIVILDPACGCGVLIFKLLDKILSTFLPKEIKIDVYDIDSNVIDIFKQLTKYLSLGNIKLEIRCFVNDFLSSDVENSYDYIVMNPPYKKLKASDTPKNLETNINGQPNLYHLFINKSLEILDVSGILCVISPKNYLSGKYTEKLRNYILNNFSITKIHTFDNRVSIFNNIIQEVCIVHIEKSKKKVVQISFNGNKSIFTEFNKIIINNKTKIIQTPRNMDDYTLMRKFEKFPKGIIGNDILMITGKVVQFRVNRKENVLQENEYYKFKSGIPLVVYRHINRSVFSYEPLVKKSKNKAITLIDDKTNESMLSSNSNYILMRKNTDKSYKKIIHCVTYLKELRGDNIAIDNSIVYFTNNSNSLTKDEILGLHCIFMSKQFDAYYRMINSSHTINIYELTNMHFPDIETIRLIGKEVKSTIISATMYSEIFEKYLNSCVVKCKV